MLIQKKKPDNSKRDILVKYLKESEWIKYKQTEEYIKEIKVKIKKFDIKISGNLYYKIIQIYRIKKWSSIIIISKDFII